jgi:hypothetical protein
MRAVLSCRQPFGPTFSRDIPYPPQPGGFEGFGACREQRDPHDLALPEGPDHRHVRDIDRNTARLAAASNNERRASTFSCDIARPVSASGSSS